MGFYKGHRQEPSVVDRQDATSFSNSWKKGEEDFGPCPKAVKTRQEHECQARIDRSSSFALSPSRRLVQPQLSLARFAGRDLPVLQRARALGGFKRRVR